MAPERNLLPVIDPPRSSDESLFKGSGMTTSGAYAALSYMLCAVFLVMFNKAALSSYSFPSANVITLLQMISSISLLYVLKHWKIITFIVGDPRPSTDSGNFVRPKTLLHTLPLSLAYLLYMLAGMESVRGVNVPMYTTLRRTTVVLTMIVEYLLVGQKYSLSIVGRSPKCFVLTKLIQNTILTAACYFRCILFLECPCARPQAASLPFFCLKNPLASCEKQAGLLPEFLCVEWLTYLSSLHMEKHAHLFSHPAALLAPTKLVALIIFGVFVAGARDLSFDTHGYGIVLLSNITTAIYLTTIARIGKSSGLNSFGLMWCNGLVCAPILLFWTFVRGDWELTMKFPYLFSPGFQVVMLCSCLLAFALNYSIFLNTTLNSAVTQTICGNLKDLLTIGLGWILFGGLPFDLLNVIGQALGFVGSGLYAYLKIKGK